MGGLRKFLKSIEPVLEFAHMALLQALLENVLPSNGEQVEKQILAQR